MPPPPESSPDAGEEVSRIVSDAREISREP